MKRVKHKAREYIIFRCAAYASPLLLQLYRVRTVCRYGYKPSSGGREENGLVPLKE